MFAEVTARGSPGTAWHARQLPLPISIARAWPAASFGFRSATAGAAISARTSGPRQLKSFQFIEAHNCSDHGKPLRFGEKSGSLRIRAPVSGLAAPLFHQADAFDAHAAIHGLAHVIYRQQSDAHRCQRFHFHPCPAEGFRGCNAAHRVGLLVDLEFHPNPGQCEWMAQRNQFRSALGRPGLRQCARYRARRPLLRCPRGSSAAFPVACKYCRRQRRRDGFPVSPHVHHVRLAVRIEMREFAQSVSVCEALVCGRGT